MAAAQCSAPSLRDMTHAQGYVAYLRVAPRSTAELQPDPSVWLDACYRLAQRVERVWVGSAFLDLGVCTECEALAALRPLMRWLRQAGWRVCAGIGSSLCRAQLVVRTARTR